MKEMYLIGDRRQCVIIYEKYKYAHVTTELKDTMETIA